MKTSWAIGGGLSYGTPVIILSKYSMNPLVFQIEYVHHCTVISLFPTIVSRVHLQYASLPSVVLAPYAKVKWQFWSPSTQNTSNIRIMENQEPGCWAIIVNTLILAFKLYLLDSVVAQDKWLLLKLILNVILCSRSYVPHRRFHSSLHACITSQNGRGDGTLHGHEGLIGHVHILCTYNINHPIECVKWMRICIFQLKKP